MIVNLESKKLKKDLSKLCKIASLVSTDSYTSYLKLTAKGKFLYIEAINDIRTQILTIKFDETVCSVQEQGSCCVPAKALQQTIDLIGGDTIELYGDDNSISIKNLPVEKQDEIQTIECIHPDQWIGGSKPNNNNVIEIYRDFFLDIGRFTANSCSNDKSKAPLTAIHVHMNQNGNIQCTATDYIKISLYDYKNGTKDNIPEDISFMLPVDAAKKIPQIFEKDIDIMQANIDKQKVTLQGGNIRFSFSTEAGLDRYPPLRSYLLDDMNVSSEVNLNELHRIVGLLAAVTPKSSCNITFDKNKISFESEEKRNKSKQFIYVLQNSNIELPKNIKIAIYDLISSLSIPDGEKITIGLTSITNNAFGSLFELRQTSNNITWRQIILKARDVRLEDDE